MNVSNISALRLIIIIAVGFWGINLNAQTVAENDNSSIEHTYIGVPTFHEHGDDEIYLHRWLISSPDQMNYWHARVIHAGYNLGPDDPNSLISNHFPENGQNSYFDESNGIYEINSQPSSPWYSSHSQFKSAHQDNDMTWYDGFFICDGLQVPCGVSGNCWEADGDADLQSTNQDQELFWPPYPENAKSGAVIFRADERVILSDGFRASYNPGASTYNITPHTITEIDGSNTSARIKIVCPNHRFTDQIQILLRDISTGYPSINNIQCKAHVLNANEFELIIHSNGNEVFGNGTSVISGQSLGTAQIWHHIPDNAYFHAYTVNNFCNDDLWESNLALDVDFTSLNSSAFGSSSKFEAMDMCHYPRPEPADYNPDPVENVILDATIPSTNNTALDLVYTGTDYTCPSPNNRTAPNSLAGITTGRIEHGVNTPLCSLRYAAIEVGAKLSGVWPHAPAIWSYHNIDDASPSGDDFSGSDEIDAVDCNSTWFKDNWDSDWTNGHEDEAYQYGAGSLAKIQYAANDFAFGTTRYDLMGSRYFVVNFTQIPNNTTNSSFSDDFHTYSYEWVPGEVRFFFADANGNNKVEVGRTTRFIPEHPMNVLVTNQWGPSTAPLAHMYISTVKAKRLSASNSCGVVANKRTIFDNPSPNSISIPNDIEIQSISPNPAQDNVSVQIKYLTQNSGEFPIVIELYDLLGNVVKQVYNGIEQYSERSYDFSTSRLPNGKYYLRASSGGKSATKSLVIQR